MGYNDRIVEFTSSSPYPSGAFAKAVALELKDIIASDFGSCDIEVKKDDGVSYHAVLKHRGVNTIVRGTSGTTESSIEITHTNASDNYGQSGRFITPKCNYNIDTSTANIRVLYNDDAMIIFVSDSNRDTFSGYLALAPIVDIGNGDAEMCMCAGSNTNNLPDVSMPSWYGVNTGYIDMYNSMETQSGERIVFTDLRSSEGDKNILGLKATSKCSLGRVFAYVGQGGYHTMTMGSFAIMYYKEG